MNQIFCMSDYALFTDILPRHSTVHYTCVFCSFDCLSLYHIDMFLLSFIIVCALISAVYFRNKLDRPHEYWKRNYEVSVVFHHKNLNNSEWIIVYILTGYNSHQCGINKEWSLKIVIHRFPRSPYI